MAKKPTKPVKLVKSDKADSNVVRMPNVFDPDQVNQRLYKQVSVLLRQLEGKDSFEQVTIRERIAALIAVGRIQQIFIAMRKATGDVGAGATVKKFSAAFAPHAAGGRADDAGAGPQPVPGDWFEQAERANDDDGFTDEDDGGDAA